MPSVLIHDRLTDRLIPFFYEDECMDGGHLISEAMTLLPHLHIFEGMNLLYQGRKVENRRSLKSYSMDGNHTPAIFTLVPSSLGLKGGKGGFGALLRSSGRVGRRTTADFGACRDLSGRRLRHVNDEIRLKKWYEAQQRKEKDGEVGVDVDVDKKTETGLNGWHLSVPTWVEGVKAKRRNQAGDRNRRKTRLCSDWVRAREGGRVPGGAPRWWGCPRGRDCEFAHGDDELRGEGREQWKRLMGRNRESEYERKLKYYSSFDDDPSDVLDSVRVGLDVSRSKGKATGSANRPVSSAMDVGGAIPEGSSYVCLVSGDASISQYGEICGKAKFSTVAVNGCQLTGGRWYYEIQLLSDGLMQLGWANSSFKANSNEGDGVGDDVNSWGFDGMRQQFWNGTSIRYGTEWAAGDIVGCFVDAFRREFRYHLNGIDLGVASRFTTENFRLFPAVSLEEGETVIINIGHEPFVYDEYVEGGFRAVSDHIISVKSSDEQTEEFPERRHEHSRDGIHDPETSTMVPDSPRKEQRERLVDSGCEDRKAPCEEIQNSRSIDTVESYHDEYLKTLRKEQYMEMGLKQLKFLLEQRGVKCGGTLEERAERLRTVVDCDGEIPPSLMAKRKKT